ncbi:ATP-binding protein [Stackebrandtia nassauensis]|uniref:Transcriptional regulator, XRE family n=1 Tax=Stackebrandtia nassauensis (strain DSM 44728 / CIP 108903 / NRRL B-16338 / NBRC 102104 / LLR-40K-21) TaxID=446470 RepID=D3Q6V5_STANL|nr:tetratricopeptide repeat protein [Stackebrandtia nassauensis]ADD40354.1 transcriptional regulator, XRE family [Stackebrandtia nassauensis DSM 44728]
MPPETEKTGTCGRLLRAHRLQAGLSQERLAQKAALSPRTIRQIESGRSQPRASTLKLLAEALGLSEADWTALLETALPDSQPSTPVVDETPDAAPADVPRQLPAAPRRFTGRALELTELDAAVGEEPLWIITGAGGIGKTWLALRWAHDNAGQFPDGQLYLNLRGFDPDASPVPTAEALRQLLYALDVDPSVMPRDTQSRAGLYRSLLADRRILVVLDNARDEEQVTDLLPGTPSCATLITSREDLMGLTATQGARQVRLSVFDDTEALRALTNQLGEQRVKAEPDAVADLVRHCGGMPLALGIVAARAAAHPRFPLSVLAAELQDEADRLDALDTGDLWANLRSVFAGSVRQLPPRAEQSFALLGLAPNGGISAHAAASLIGGKLPETRGIMRELEASSLAEQYTPGRYRTHDLIHLYAAEQSMSELSATERIAAQRRLVDHYVHTAEIADSALLSFRERHDLGTPAPGCLTTPVPDRAAALWWFDLELPNVLAAQRTAYQHGWHDKVWELAWLLKAAINWYGWFDEEIEIWTAAAESAVHLDKARARTQSHLYLGQALLYRKRFDEAREQLKQALVSAEADADQPNVIGAHYITAQTYQLQDDPAAALPHALNAFQAASHPDSTDFMRGQALNLLGWNRALSGDFDLARGECEQALELLSGNDYAEPLAEAQHNLGYIAQRQHRHPQALEHYRRALELYRESSGGRRTEEAKIHDQLGDVHAAMGDDADALRHWRQSRDRFQALNRESEAEVVAAKIVAEEKARTDVVLATCPKQDGSGTLPSPYDVGLWQSVSLNSVAWTPAV